MAVRAMASPLSRRVLDDSGHQPTNRLQRKCTCGGSCHSCRSKGLAARTPSTLATPSSVGRDLTGDSHPSDSAQHSHAFGRTTVFANVQRSQGTSNDLNDPLSDHAAPGRDAGPPQPAPDAGPAAACPNGVKTVSVDFVSLRGSTGDPIGDLALANTIYAPCCVQFAMASGRTASGTDSDRWLGGDTVMERSTTCGSATSEETAAYQGAERAFGLSGRMRVFYVESSNPGDRGRSVPPVCATGTGATIPNMVMVINAAAPRTLAHEFGHILLNPGTHAMPPDNLMHVTNTATANNLTPAQCATIFANA